MNQEIPKIKEWINKNGYPLEMYTSRIFKNNGFNVAQSLYYKDISTEKYREIDILAHKNNIVNNVSINISFVIECKKSVKPWIIFVDNNLAKKNQIFGSRNAQLLFDKIKRSQIKS